MKKNVRTAIFILKLKGMTHLMDHMKFETPDLTSENIDRIAALFPNCVTEMQDENGKLKRGINF